MTLRDFWSRSRLPIVVVGLALGIMAVNVGRNATQRVRDQRMFASLLMEANNDSAPRHQGLTSAIATGPLGSMVVLVRDFRDSSTTRPAYQIKSGLHWRVAVATNATEATVVLLIDRIYLNVRSYRPAGEDYQVVMHGTLMYWPTRTVIRDFVVRGPRPANRAGWLSVFGLMNRTGAEPWSAAGTIVEARLAAH